MLSSHIPRAVYAAIMEVPGTAYNTCAIYLRAFSSFPRLALSVLGPQEILPVTGIR